MADASTVDPELDEDGVALPPKEPDHQDPKPGTDEGTDSRPKENPAPDEEKNEEKDEAPSEIPVRNDVAQQIIARKNRQLEKLRSKTEEDEGADDDDERKPDPAQAAIDKAVDKRLDPFVKTLASQQDEKDLQTLFQAEPDAKKYEKRIKAYMQNEAWSQIPVEGIYAYLLRKSGTGTDTAKKEEKKRAADLEAEQSRSGGRTARQQPRATGKLPSGDEIKDMTDEEFDQLGRDVEAGKYLSA